MPSEAPKPPKGPYLSYTKIADHLPILAGDVLLIGSSLSKLILQAQKNEGEFDANRFIDSFQKKLTGEGTLLLPTFNFGFCKGEAFDLKHTPSQMGVLTSIALDRPDFSRTAHPIYSFAVSGKHRETLRRMANTSSFGPDSPFGFLYEKGAKMLIIGLDYQRSFTFVHYVEEKNKAPYRYMKNFSAKYVDSSGAEEMRTYSMYVRDLDKKVETHVNPIGEIFEKKGAAVVDVINGITFRTVDLCKAAGLIEEDLKTNQGRNLHRIGS